MQEEKKYPIGGYAPGNYHCNCCKCGTFFHGDKRAVECEPCAIAAKEKFDALSPDEQVEVMKRNAELIKEVFKDWASKPEVNLAIISHGEPAHEHPVSAAGVNDSAMYELRLALYDMIRVTKALIENRGTLLNARKRIEAAEGMLNKHFKITDVLRTESNEQPVEQKAVDIAFGVDKWEQWRAWFSIGVQKFHLQDSENKEHAEWYEKMLRIAFANLTGNGEQKENEAVAFAEWMDERRNSGTGIWEDLTIWDKENAFQLIYNEYQKQNKQ